MHSRHLEDLVQHLAMDWIVKNGKFNWEWSYFDYCRINGLGKRGKMGARPIENSTFVGSVENNECEEFDGELFLSLGEVEKFEEQEKSERQLDAFELLGDTLGLKQETLEWVRTNYKV